MGEFQGNDKTEDVGPLPLLIVSPKRTWREGTGNTTRTAGPELDMQDISPAICHQAAVARIDLFPNLFLNWSIKIKGRIPVTQSMCWNQDFK